MWISALHDAPYDGRRVKAIKLKHNKGHDATSLYVDFVRIHHWSEAAELDERIQTIRAATDKPILLEDAEHHFGLCGGRITAGSLR